MKKVIALALVIILAAIFTACKKDDTESETTTLNVTMPTATTKVQDVTEAANEPATMVLTTAYGETMPTVVTTVFNLANEMTTVIDVNPELTTVDMSIPDVFTSNIPTTTEPSTTSPVTAGTEPIDNETTVEDTENQSDTQGEDTTASKEPSLKSIETNSTSFSNGRIIFDIDPSEWNGGVKTKKISIITVEYDGKKKSVSGSVIGLVDSADNSQIIVNTNDLNIPDGATVNITIPAGAVVSKNGDQTSRQLVASVTYEKG
ncbi:MAG: hypothetical protein ACI4W6_02955 [Acutalibacteraceae bacterium]